MWEFFSILKQILYWSHQIISNKWLNYHIWWLLYRFSKVLLSVSISVHIINLDHKTTNINSKTIANIDVLSRMNSRMYLISYRFSLISFNMFASRCIEIRSVCMKGEPPNLILIKANRPKQTDPFREWLRRKEKYILYIDRSFDDSSKSWT